MCFAPSSPTIAFQVPSTLRGVNSAILPRTGLPPAVETSKRLCDAKMRFFHFSILSSSRLSTMPDHELTTVYPDAQRNLGPSHRWWCPFSQIQRRQPLRRNRRLDLLQPTLAASEELSRAFEFTQSYTPLFH